MSFNSSLLALCVAASLPVTSAFGTNPLILDQFTADPTARVFEGRLYVYPSHDIRPTPGKGRPDWFCMEDYHVFSSANLTDWQDHGVIVSQTSVPWVDPTTFSLWAPDCVAKDGRYYFYFPAQAKTGGFRIGVAVADHPTGPFTPEPRPIEGVQGIDPCVLLDADGSAYLYYAMRSKVSVAKLKDNLRELASPPVVVANLPTQGLVEGPFVFVRNGVYYLTYPHVEHRTERLEYAMGTHPLGPFKPAGVILDESASGCWTVHQSLVEFQGQWYLFYHDNDLSPDFDKNRSIRADRLYFNPDGTIHKVVPTLRGVGVVPAGSQIQVDRYSAISPQGAKVSFVDPAKPSEGWKLSLSGPQAWGRFDAVDFGAGGVRTLEVRATTSTGGAVEIHLDRRDGPLLARVDIPPSEGWHITRVPTPPTPSGLHDLFFSAVRGGELDLDWIRF